MSSSNPSPRKLIVHAAGDGTSTPALLGGDVSTLNLLALYLQRYDREQTRRAYARDLRDFFESDEIRFAQAHQTTFVEVNAFIARLEHQGYKPATIKRRVAAIRGFFDWLVALGALERNPASRSLLRRVRASRQRDKAVSFLSAEQARRLLSAAQASERAGPRDGALLLTMLHCVLRRSEAAAMDTHHIRPLGKYWILDLPSTKGGADQYVKVPEHVVEAIESMKAHYDITSGPLWRSLSSNNAGGRLSAHSVYRIVKQTAERAGLTEEIGAHTLRHTGCTLAIEAGASIQQVQAHARHKSIETTMVYVHQRDRLRDSAADFIQIDDPESPA